MNEVKKEIPRYRMVAIQMLKYGHHQEPINEELMKKVSEMNLIEKCGPFKNLTELLTKAKELNNDLVYDIISNFCIAFLESSKEKREELLNRKYEAMKDLIEYWNEA